MSRKICVVTGSRAEYGLLRWVMHGIKNDSSFVLQIIATGMHLSPEFGLTYKEIEKDGFLIDRKIEMLVSSNTSVGEVKSMGLGLIGFAEAFAELEPDLIVLLGDRFEVFTAASAALVAGIQIAHVHGGETTEGSIDEAFRHSITKMSHFHFVATEAYRRRVIQLGEQPDSVFNVGGLGVDSIKRLKLLDRTALEAELNFKLGNKNLLITFHPTAVSEDTSASQLKELLMALAELKDTHFIFTLPNADRGGRGMIQMVHDFVGDHPTARVYASLGQLNFLSCVAHMDAVIGNSSSGLLEVPSLHKATINIGIRQKGRVQAESVLNCEPKRDQIAAALQKIYLPDFKDKLMNRSNPYGEGGASDKILAMLNRCVETKKNPKVFYDLPNL